MLLDLTHTSHTRALTGIQRVSRGLWREFGAQATPICHDPHARTWRPLDARELANLAAAPSGRSRRARWPLSARLRGFLRRGRPVTAHASLPAAPDGLLIPEIFSPGAAAAMPALFAAVAGPRAALFYDAVALKYPELTPPKIVARYPAYLRELLAFDGIAAISEDARDALLEYWGWLEVKDHPPVVAITLGVEAIEAKWHGLPAHGPGDHGLEARATASANTRPVVLSVGTLEGRKNHAALLEACERLWAGGVRFELRLIGAARPETGRAVLERIAALQAAGRPLRYDGVVDDGDLAEAYATCAFTVYPSLMEGFGLPVTESLARGKPCVCSGQGALGESARGGGCLALDAVDAASLAGAIGRLLADPAALERLSAEARARKFKSAADYAREVREWMASLARRGAVAP